MADSSFLPPLPDDLEELLTEDLLSMLASAEDFSSGPDDILFPVHSNDVCQLSSPSGSSDLMDVLNLTTHPMFHPSPSSSDSGDAIGPTGDSAASSRRIITTAVPTQAPPPAETTCKDLSCSHGLSSGDYALESAFTSDDSDSDEDNIPASGENGRGQKRKAPEVDWRTISDPAERRRQRRLAKNRVTAARSRERKKTQWSGMEQSMRALEQENSQLKNMLERLTRENGSLKTQLVTLAQNQTSRWNGNSVEPAVLVLISSLLLLCCFLPTEMVLLLGSCTSLAHVVKMSLFPQQMLLEPELAASASSSDPFTCDRGGQIFTPKLLFSLLSSVDHRLCCPLHALRRCMQHVMVHHASMWKCLRRVCLCSPPSLHSSGLKSMTWSLGRSADLLRLLS